jgi:ABC-type transporter Mla subunit MlaD
MSSRWRQLTLVVVGVVVAVAAVAIAGIAFGGESTPSATRAEYQASVVDVRDRVDIAMLRITQSTSIEQLIERIAQASTAVGAAAADLGDAGVADGYGDETEDLVRTLQAFSDELANTSEQFEDPTFEPNLTNINSLGFQGWDKVNEDLAELRSQGIRVPLLQRH